MKIKNIPMWLKGGIILVLIYTFFYLLTYLALFHLPMVPDFMEILLFLLLLLDILLFALPLNIIKKILFIENLFLFNNGSEFSHIFPSLKGFFVMIIIVFFIGLIIGQIINKIKKRDMQNEE